MSDKSANPPEDPVTDPGASTNLPAAEVTFEELASEFAERQRKGEIPSVEEYAQDYPDLAEEIRELFPTIAAMEQLKTRKAPPPRPMLGGLPLEQLGDFRILGEIGRGGMGVVYEAEQVSLGRHVAVKVLPKQALLDQRHLRRFEREAQTAAKLHHTNIVPVFGIGQQDGYHYIVMQFIPGVGLDEILIALRKTVLDEDSGSFRVDSSSRASHANHNAKALLDGRFEKQSATGFSASLVRTNGATPMLGSGSDATQALTSSTASAASQSDVVENDSAALNIDQSSKLSQVGVEYYHSVAKIGVQVADALAYAHEQGTLHRDIKPGNLLLDGAGTVWVADFGLAKLAEQDNVSRTGDIVGTLSYMPPESFSGDAGPRGDIYALGLSLFELLALRPAYFGRDRAKLVKQITEGDLPRLRKLNPSIPRDLETIVLKAIAHRPQDRYLTANELAEDLQRYLDDRPILARRVSAPEALWRWCRRNRLVASLAASAVSLLVLTALSLGVAARNAVRARNTETEAKLEEAKLRKEAESSANEATAALMRTFDLLAGPNRLPLSSDTSLRSAEVTTFDTLTENDTSLDNESDVSTLVAPPPMTEDILNTLEQMLPDIDRLSRKGGSEGRSALTSAELKYRLGKAQMALGKLDEARTSFDDAIKTYRGIEDPTLMPAAVVGLVQCCNDLGRCLVRAGDHSAANNAYALALKLLGEHPKIVSTSNLARYERARTLYLTVTQSVGPSRSRGELGRSGPEFSMNGGPGFPRFGGRLRPGGPEGRGGPGAGRSGRPNGPRRPGGPNDGRDEEFAGPEPSPDWAGRGNRERRFPNRSEVGTHLTTAIDELEELRKAEANPEYRYLLARCYVERARGRSREPNDLDRATELLKDLVQEKPHVADYRFELAMAYGRPFGGRGRVSHEEDAERLRAAVRELDRLVEENPDITLYALMRHIKTLDLASVLNRAAERSKALGEDWKMDANEAADLYGASFAMRQALARTSTLDLPGPPQKVTEMYLRLRSRQVQLLRDLGRKEEAVSAIRSLLEESMSSAEFETKSVAVVAELCKLKTDLVQLLDPDNPDAQPLLASARETIESQIESASPAFPRLAPFEGCDGACLPRAPRFRTTRGGKRIAVARSSKAEGSVARSRVAAEL